MIRGYHDDKLIPLLPGMQVRIKKGTVLHSTHPRREGKFEAGRTYTVKAHHILPGQTYTLGTIYEKPDGSRKTYINGIHWRELYHICQDLGVNYPYSTTPDADLLLEELQKTGQIDIIERPSGNFEGKVFDVKLHSSNPLVNWAGESGYWVWADINDVEIIGWYVDCEGQVLNLSEKDIDTVLFEDHGDHISVLVGGRDSEPGFRVDDTYVYHPSFPKLG